MKLKDRKQPTTAPLMSITAETLQRRQKHRLSFLFNLAAQVAISQLPPKLSTASANSKHALNDARG